jgi:hypothetical protein
VLPGASGFLIIGISGREPPALGRGRSCRTPDVFLPIRWSTARATSSSRAPGRRDPGRRGLLLPGVVHRRGAVRGLSATNALEGLSQ